MVKHDIDLSYVRPSPFRNLTLWLLPLFVFVGSLVLYGRTMAPSLFWGDATVSAATGLNAGIASDPVSPLYILLAKLFMLIPAISPAMALNAMSVLFGALVVTMFYMLVRMFIDVPEHNSVPKHFVQPSDDNRRMRVVEDESIVGSSLILLPVLAVTALFAISLPMWLSAVRAEVYSLQLFLMMAAFYACFKGVGEEQRRLIFLGFWLYAISFANHPLMALAFTPAFGWLFFSQWSKFGPKWGTVTVVLFFAATAFSIYFYLPLNAASQPAAGAGVTFGHQLFGDSILRSFGLNDIFAAATLPEYLIRLKKTGLFMADQIGWPLVGLTLLGFWGIYKISKKLFPFMLLGLLFSLVVFIQTGDFDARNYNLVSCLAPLVGLMLIIGAAGFMYIIRIKMLTTHASVMMTILVGAFVFVGANDNIERADLSGVHGPDLISLTVNRDVPAGSILMVAEDNLLLPMWYRAYVDSTAREINIISPVAMVNPEYRKQVALNYPHLYFPDKFTDDLPGKADEWAKEIIRLNEHEREIYVQFGTPGVGHDEIVPHGIVFRYEGRGKKISFKPDFYQTHIDLALSMIEGCERESRTAEFTGRWLFTLGVYYERHGYHDISWQLFKRALTVDQGSIDLRLHLATALAKAKRYKEALKYISDALEIDSQDPSCLKLGRDILDAMKSNENVMAHKD